MAQESQIHLRTCPLCEAMCGLQIAVSHGRIGDIRPDEEDIFSRGHICPKGTTLGSLHEDPDRLRVPMIKTSGGEHREATWDEAFARMDELLRPVIDRHGAESVAMYIGNPTAHNLSLMHYVGALVGMAQAAGFKHMYSAGTVDQWPNNVVSALMYGGMWTISVPDIDRAHYLLMLGANPSASQGSLLAAPDVMGRLAALRKRGGRVVVVDPRRTETAAKADRWVPIRPGTDALFLFAVLNTLQADGLVSPGEWLETHVDGLEEALALAAPFTPDHVAESCGIPASTIRQIAHDLAAAPRAAVYGRIGTCTQEFGTLTQWLIELCNIATGNLDREGGKMFPRSPLYSVLDVRPPDQSPDGWQFGRWKSRVRGAPEVLGQVPVSCLAEEIATPGDGRVRALLTIAGNPVISTPGAGELDAALPQLECMISVDNWLNETTRHADVVLPGLSPLEQAHHGDLLLKFAVHSVAHWSPAVIEPDDGRPGEWEILLHLAGAMLGMWGDERSVKNLDDAYFAGVVDTYTSTPRHPLYKRKTDEIIAAAPDINGPERMLDLAVRCGPHGDLFGKAPEGLTLERLKTHERGIDFGKMRGRRLSEVLTTKSRKVELLHDHILDDIDRLLQHADRPQPELVLTSRRHLRSNNSWMHNVPELMTGRDRCTLLMHPTDAARAGVGNGELACVESSAGELTVAVEVSDEMMPGVVSLPHGWGHDRPGARTRTASQFPGVNSNLLNPGTLVDVPSGNAVVNGVPVDVRPADDDDRIA